MKAAMFGRRPLPGCRAWRARRVAQESDLQPGFTAAQFYPNANCQKQGDPGQPPTPAATVGGPGWHNGLRLGSPARGGHRHRHHRGY